MTLKALIDFVDALKENTFSSEVKTAWVNEIEGQIQTEVHLLAVADVVQYVWQDDQNAELVVPPPYDKLYRYYLEAMIAFEQEEMDRYQNIQQMFQKCFLEYVGFVASTINPANGCAERAQYYLSAYGLAVKLGYVGTPEEWLESLKGPKGDPFQYEDFTEEQLDELTAGIQEYATTEAIKAAQEKVEEAAQEAANSVEDIVESSVNDAQAAADRAEEAIEKTPKVGQNGNWYTWNATIGEYEDSGKPATALANENGGAYIRLWFGTVQEYNNLPFIDENVYYNILEGEP